MLTFSVQVIKEYYLHAAISAYIFCLALWDFHFNKIIALQSLV